MRASTTIASSTPARVGSGSAIDAPFARLVCEYDARLRAMSSPRSAATRALRRSRTARRKRMTTARPGADETMLDLLWALAMLLVVAWALGVAFHVLGGAVHGLLALAVASGALRLVLGRRPA